MSRKKKTRKFLSVESILEAMRNPKALQQGYANDVMDIIIEDDLVIKIGSSRFINCPIPLMFDNQPVIQLSKIAFSGVNKFALSAKFYDKSGELSLEIIDNE